MLKSWSHHRYRFLGRFYWEEIHRGGSRWFARGGCFEKKVRMVGLYFYGLISSLKIYPKLPLCAWSRGHPWATASPNKFWIIVVDHWRRRSLHADRRMSGRRRVGWSCIRLVAISQYWSCGFLGRGCEASYIFRQLRWWSRSCFYYIVDRQILNNWKFDIIIVLVFPALGGV